MDFNNIWFMKLCHEMYLIHLNRKGHFHVNCPPVCLFQLRIILHWISTFTKNILTLFHRSGLFPPHTICQLCSKPYTDPRILPCLHSFCGQCLHMEIERSGAKQKMECPTCQRSITIPEDGVNDIPQNLHLGYEVEVAGYMSKIGSGGEKSCDVCIDGGKGPAVVFCCTCCQFLCTFCHEYHKRSKSLHHHQMVRVLDQESVRLLPSIMTPTEYLCSQPHPEKVVSRFYCETCRCLVCGDCTLVFHKDHRIGKVCNVAEVHRDGMGEALVCAQEMASKLTSAIGTTDMMAEQVETSRENAIQLINQTIEQLHQAIEIRKGTLLSELEAILLPKTTSLSLQKEQLLKLQDEIGRYIEMIYHILQTHNDHEVVALGDLLPTELKATLKKVEGVSLTPSQTSAIHVALQTDSLMKEISMLGHVMECHSSPAQSIWSSESSACMNKVFIIRVETKSSEGEKYSYGGLQVKVELKPKSHDGAVVAGKVEDHGDGTYTITLTPQAAGPHQLLVTMDGEHVQGSPHDLDVRNKYSSLCNPQQVISCSGSLTGIAIHDSGDIYVASWSENSIHVFDQNGHEKRSIGSDGSGDGQFSKPLGISIKGNEMYVADFGNNRIQKLTASGQYLKKFSRFQSGQGELNGPISVSVDQRDRMIVADFGNNRVVILDQNGSCLLTINGNVSSAQGFKDPWDLALDPQGNIHDAAYGSNTIKVFTPEGTYVRSYGDVKGPSGIVIDDEGYSFVSENKCLSIFDPLGKKIHTVGNIYSICGVALDPISGSLYIANSSTKTVLKCSM